MLVSTELSIFALKHQFRVMTWEYCIWSDSKTQRKIVTRFTYLFSVAEEGAVVQCLEPTPALTRAITAADDAASRAGKTRFLRLGF